MEFIPFQRTACFHERIEIRSTTKLQSYSWTAAYVPRSPLKLTGDLRPPLAINIPRSPFTSPACHKLLCRGDYFSLRGFAGFPAVRTVSGASRSENRLR